MTVIGDPKEMFPSQFQAGYVHIPPCLHVLGPHVQPVCVCAPFSRPLPPAVWMLQGVSSKVNSVGGRTSSADVQEDTLFAQEELPAAPQGPGVRSPAVATEGRVQRVQRCCPHSPTSVVLVVVGGAFAAVAVVAAAAAVAAVDAVVLVVVVVEVAAAGAAVAVAIA